MMDEHEILKKKAQLSTIMTLGLCCLPSVSHKKSTKSLFRKALLLLLGKCQWVISDLNAQWLNTFGFPLCSCKFHHKQTLAYFLILVHTSCIPICTFSSCIQCYFNVKSQAKYLGFYKVTQKDPTKLFLSHRI